MSVDPLDLLNLADFLASKKDECYLRSATNRAYYSMFLIAREVCGITGHDDVHSRTISALRGQTGAYGLADVLDSLRKLRVEADYNLLPSRPKYADWEENWKDVKSYLEVLHPALDDMR